MEYAVYSADLSACSLTASAPTSWAPVGIQLTVAVVPDGDIVPISGSRTLWKQLSIDVVEELKALELDVVKKNDKLSVHRGETGEMIVLGMYLYLYQRCSELLDEEKVSEEGESFGSSSEEASDDDQTRP